MSAKQAKARAEDAARAKLAAASAASNSQAAANSHATANSHVASAASPQQVVVKQLPPLSPRGGAAAAAASAESVKPSARVASGYGQVANSFKALSSVPEAVPASESSSPPVPAAAATSALSSPSRLPPLVSRPGHPISAPPIPELNQLAAPASALAAAAAADKPLATPYFTQADRDAIRQDTETCRSFIRQDAARKDTPMVNDAGDDDDDGFHEEENDSLHDEEKEQVAGALVPVEPSEQLRTACEHEVSVSWSGDKCALIRRNGRDNFSHHTKPVLLTAEALARYVSEHPMHVGPRQRLCLCCGNVWYVKTGFTLYKKSLKEQKRVGKRLEGKQCIACHFVLIYGKPYRFDNIDAAMAELVSWRAPKPSTNVTKRSAAAASRPPAKRAAVRVPAPAPAISSSHGGGESLLDGALRVQQQQQQAATAEEPDDLTWLDEPASPLASAASSAAAAADESEPSTMDEDAPAAAAAAAASQNEEEEEQQTKLTERLTDLAVKMELPVGRFILENFDMFMQTLEVLPLHDGETKERFAQVMQRTAVELRAQYEESAEQERVRARKEIDLLQRQREQAEQDYNRRLQALQQKLV